MTVPKPRTLERAMDEHAGNLVGYEQNRCPVNVDWGALLARFLILLARRILVGIQFCLGHDTQGIDPTYDAAS